MSSSALHERDPLQLDDRTSEVLSGDAPYGERLEVERLELGAGLIGSHIGVHGNLTTHPFDSHTLLLSGDSHPLLRGKNIPLMTAAAEVIKLREMDTLALEWLEVNDTILLSVLGLVCRNRRTIRNLRIGMECTFVAERRLSRYPIRVQLPATIGTVIVGDDRDLGPRAGHNTGVQRGRLHLVPQTKSQPFQLCLVGGGLLEPVYYAMFTAGLNKLFISGYHLSADFFDAIHPFNKELNQHLKIDMSSIEWPHVHICPRSATVLAEDLQKLWRCTIEQASHPEGFRCCRLQRLVVLCEGREGDLQSLPDWFKDLVKDLQWGTNSQLVFMDFPKSGGMLRQSLFEGEVKRVLNLREVELPRPTICFDSTQRTN